jgi:membrane protease YdiL (CAAX protease family)
MSTCARLGWLKTMDHRNPVRSEAPLRIPDAPQSRLFYNEAGLRSGWRILIYLGQAMVLAVVVNLLLARFVHAHKDMAPPWLMFIDEVAWLLPVFVPVLFMARLERRPPGAYGLPSEGLFGARFWQGCALGAVEIVVLVGAIAAFGGYSFGRRSLSGPQVLVWALFWALFFVVVGLFEEFTFRGYLQYTLGDGIGFWPAAWILSLGFGAVHLMNQGESLVGAAGVEAHRQPLAGGRLARGIRLRGDVRVFGAQQRNGLSRAAVRLEPARPELADRRHGRSRRELFQLPHHGTRGAVHPQGITRRKARSSAGDRREHCARRSVNQF